MAYNRLKRHYCFANGGELFSSETVMADLKGRTVRGAATTFGGQGLAFVLGIGSTAILARILTPEDFGLIAMTVVFTGFISMFQDAGLAMATVQQPKISHEQVSTLFWMNTLLALGISLVVVLIAPVVAAFYSDPRLAGVTRGLALGIFVSGVATQHKALLRRQMKFAVLAWTDLGSMTIGVVAGVGLAWLGYGYWSLVGMAVMTAFSGAVWTWLLLPWIPGLPRRRVGAGKMLRFGTDILTFNVVNYFARQADNLLIGWLWGPVALGFYEKAYRILLMPVRQINGPMSAVVVPALSRINHDPERFARLYLKALELLTSVSVPVVLAFCVFADEVVWLWLGPNWQECAHLFRLLTLAAVVGAIQNPVGWLMIAAGNTRTYKLLGVASSILIVSSFVIGLPYGAEGVAIAYSIAACVNFFPTWWFATRNTPVSFGRLLKSFSAPVSAGVIAGGAGYAASQILLPRLGHVGSVIVAGLLYVALYGGVLFVGFGRWKPFQDVVRELRLAKS